MDQPHPLVIACRDKLDQCRGYWGDVAASSGVSYSWIQKFAGGHIPNPGIETLQQVDAGCDAVLAIISALPTRAAV